MTSVSTTGGSISGNPVSGNPVSGNPVSGNPVSGNPVSGNSVSGNSVSGNPVSGNPVSGNPVSGNPVSGNPVSGNPVSGNPVSGNPVSGNPVSGNPVSGNPVSGNPVSGNPVSGNPVSGNWSAGDEQQVVDALETLLSLHPVESTPAAEFWGHQFDAGLAWVNFPVGHGGMGLAPGLQRVVDARLADANASRLNVARNVIGHGMGAPTVVAHGSEQQMERWLRPMFTGEEIWCQLFSEPGVGSDVAGLATRAVKDGDEWIVNGQKVWTTLAHTSRWGMVVARTDADLPKHQGLTYFIVDMKQPGVEVRPLRQITGEAEFNEVYFTDARIPDEYRLGAVGDGWRVALTTLMNERVAIGSTQLPRGGGAIADTTAVWTERALTDPFLKDEMMKLWCEAEVLRLTGMRASQSRALGTPGPEGSTSKLHWADLNKRISSFTVDLMGADGMLLPEGYPYVTPEEAGSGRLTRQKSFLRARANSIEGGTSEIMKNILGERVLGLPGEPRVDKDVPWKQVPR